jgi:hypothetical protein
MDKLPRGDNEYRVLKANVKIKKDELKSLKKGKSGIGLQSVRNFQHDSQTCPSNIFGDISRLEVLIGGKRAGNNSVEIINEAANICRRFFQSSFMNIHTYRELIDELMEVHGYSD